MSFYIDLVIFGIHNVKLCYNRLYTSTYGCNYIEAVKLCYNSRLHTSTRGRNYIEAVKLCYNSLLHTSTHGRSYIEVVTTLRQVRQMPHTEIDDFFIYAQRKKLSTP